MTTILMAGIGAAFLLIFWCQTRAVNREALETLRQYLANHHGDPDEFHDAVEAAVRQRVAAVMEQVQHGAYVVKDGARLTVTGPIGFLTVADGGTVLFEHQQGGEG